MVLIMHCWNDPFRRQGQLSEVTRSGTTKELTRRREDVDKQHARGLTARERIEVTLTDNIPSVNSTP
jgi:hypothetical protein